MHGGCPATAAAAPVTAVPVTAATFQNQEQQSQQQQQQQQPLQPLYMYSQEQLLRQKKRNQEVWERIQPSLDSSTLALAETNPPANNAVLLDMCVNIWANITEKQDAPELIIQEQSQEQDQGQEQEQSQDLLQELAQEQSQSQSESKEQEQEQEQAVQLQDYLRHQDAVACGHLCHFNEVICCGCNDLRPVNTRCDAVIGGIVIPDAGQRREEYCAECRNAYEVMPYERQVCALMTAFPHRSDVGAAACFTLCTEIQGAIQKLVKANNLLFGHAIQLQLSR